MHGVAGPVIHYQEQFSFRSMINSMDDNGVISDFKHALPGCALLYVSVKRDESL